MAIPSKPTANRQTKQSPFWLQAATFAMAISLPDMASGTSLSKPEVVETSTTVTATPGDPWSISNAVDSPEENAACIVDLLDDNFSDSMGNELPYCHPGERMGSNDKPCPDGRLCCPCVRGTFQANDSTCDTCIKHRQCQLYGSQGTATSDSICRDPPEMDEIPTATDISLTEPQAIVTGPDEVDTGQVTMDVSPPPSCEPHSPCRNGGSCGFRSNRELQCFCRDQWEGKYCHIAVTSSSKAVIPWPNVFGIFVFCVVMFPFAGIIYLKKKYKTQRPGNHEDSDGMIPDPQEPNLFGES